MNEFEPIELPEEQELAGGPEDPKKKNKTTAVEKPVRGKLPERQEPFISPKEAYEKRRKELMGGRDESERLEQLYGDKTDIEQDFEAQRAEDEKRLREFEGRVVAQWSPLKGWVNKEGLPQTSFKNGDIVQRPDGYLQATGGAWVPVESPKRFAHLSDEEEATRPIRVIAQRPVSDEESRKNDEFYTPRWGVETYRKFKSLDPSGKLLRKLAAYPEVLDAFEQQQGLGAHKPKGKTTEGIVGEIFDPTAEDKDAFPTQLTTAEGRVRAFENAVIKASRLNKSPWQRADGSLVDNFEWEKNLKQITASGIWEALKDTKAGVVEKASRLKTLSTQFPDTTAYHDLEREVARQREELAQIRGEVDPSDPNSVRAYRAQEAVMLPQINRGVERLRELGATLNSPEQQQRYRAYKDLYAEYQGELARYAAMADEAQGALDYFKRPENDEVLKTITRQQTGLELLEQTASLFPEYSEHKRLVAQQQGKDQFWLSSAYKSFMREATRTLAGIGKTLGDVFYTGADQFWADVNMDNLNQQLELHYATPDRKLIKGTKYETADFTADAFDQFASILPSMILTSASSGVRLAEGVLIGASTFQAAKQEAATEGLSGKPALIFAGLKGLAEWGSEQIFGDNLLKGFTPSRRLVALGLNRAAKGEFRKVLREETLSYLKNLPRTVGREAVEQFTEEKAMDLANLVVNAATNRATGLSFDETLPSFSDNVKMGAAMAMTALALKGGAAFSTVRQSHLNEGARDLMLLRAAAGDYTYALDVLRDLKGQEGADVARLQQVENEVGELAGMRFSRSTTEPQKVVAFKLLKEIALHKRELATVDPQLRPAMEQKIESLQKELQRTLQTPATAQKELERTVVPVLDAVDEVAMAESLPTPLIDLSTAVEGYRQQHGEEFSLPEPVEVDMNSIKAEPQRAKRISDAYEALPDNDIENPEVKAAYDQLGREVEAQYRYLTEQLGIQVEFTEGDPYKNSREMMDDVQNNLHLFVYKGGEDHAALGTSTTDKDGVTLTEKFRAVHDFFGHAVDGNQFGKHGEERAWVAHSRMFSPMAQRAMTTETRGQNSFVNFSGVNEGALKKIAQGNKLIKAGKVAEGEALIAQAKEEFQFARQKVALLPEEFSDYRVHAKKPESQPKRERSKVFTAQNAKEAQREAKKYKGAQRRVLQDVGRVIGVLSEIAPHLSVKIHYSPASFMEAALGTGAQNAEAAVDTAGFYLDTKGQIHLNFSDVEHNTLVHEGAHPFLDAVVRHSPGVLDRAYEELARLPEGRPYVDFGAQYEPSQQKVEAVVEFLADVATGKLKLNPTLVDRLRNIVAALLRALGFKGSPKALLRLKEGELRRLAAAFSRGMNSGRPARLRELAREASAAGALPLDRQAPENRQAEANVLQLQQKPEGGGDLFSEEGAPDQLRPLTLPMFENFEDFRRMKGKVVKVESIRNQLNRQGVKQIEKEIVQEVLSTEEFAGKPTLPFDLFRQRVEAAIMPLERIDTSSYASYGMGNLGRRYPYGEAVTVIYNAPVEHGEYGHFSSAFKGANLRDKDWEIMELQGRFAVVQKDHPPFTRDNIMNYVGTVEDSRQKAEEWISQQQSRRFSDQLNVGLFGHVRLWKNEDEKLWHLAELQSDYFQKNNARKAFTENNPKANEMNDRENMRLQEAWVEEKLPELVKNLEELGLGVHFTQHEGSKPWRATLTWQGELVNSSLFDRENAVGGLSRYAGDTWVKTQSLVNALRPSFGVLARTVKIANMVERSRLELLEQEVRNNQDYAAIQERLDSLEQQPSLTEAKARQLYDSFKDAYQDRMKEIYKEADRFVEKNFKLSPAERQFIASQKGHELRLLRETIKDAAKQGAQTLRFPTPKTLAVIEGYISEDGGMPYELDSISDSEYLSPGDTITYDGTPMIVVESSGNSITVAPTEEVYRGSYEEGMESRLEDKVDEVEQELRHEFGVNVPDGAGGVRAQRLEELSLTAAQLADWQPNDSYGEGVKDALEAAFEEVEEKEGEEPRLSLKGRGDLIRAAIREYLQGESFGDLTGAYNVWPVGDFKDEYLYTYERVHTESFNQPGEYQGGIGENWEEELSSEQQTVVDKYKELNRLIQKERRDARVVQDDNGFEWLEFPLTEADLHRPVLAFQKRRPMDSVVEGAQADLAQGMDEEVVRRGLERRGLSPEVARGVVENAKRLPTFRALPPQRGSGIIRFPEEETTMSYFSGLDDSALEGLWKKLREFKGRFFDRAKGLPDWVLPLKDRRTGETNLELRRALQTVQQLKKQAKALGFSDWKAFDRALRSLSLPQPKFRPLSSMEAIVPFNPVRAAAQRMNTVPDAELPMAVPEALKALPEELRPFVYRMRAQIDGLSRDLIVEGLVSPEQALTIEGRIGEYMTRSYEAFNKKGFSPERSIQDDAFRFLFHEAYAQLRGLDPQLSEREVEMQAGEIANRRIREILDGIDTYSPQELRTTKGKDLGVLQRREDIPEPIRRLLGEYEDPTLNFVMTVAKQASLRSSARYLASVRQVGMGSLFFEEHDPRRPQTHSVQLKSEASEVWSPLNGLYTTPEVKELIDETERTRSVVGRIWQALIGSVRYGKTVLSPITQVKNFESNVGFALVNGHFHAQHFGGAGRYVADRLFKGETLSSEDVEEIIAQSLVGQSVGVRELREMFRVGNLDSIMAAATVTGSKQARLVKGVLKFPFRVAESLYGTSDDFWKVYGYLNERHDLSRALYGSPYMELTPEQKREVSTMAAERVKNTYPTWDRVWEGAKYVSKNIPLFGNFISFQAESIRTLLNAFHYALTDARDPRLRGYAGKRLMGIGTYLSLRTIVVKGLAQLTGMGLSGFLSAGNDPEEDKRLRAFNSYGPDFQRSGDKVTFDQGSGVYLSYDLSSLDPYGIWWRVANAFTSGNESAEAGWLAAFSEFTSPFLEQEMVFASIQEATMNQDSYGAPIYKPDDLPGEKFRKALDYLWKRNQPAVIGFARRWIQNEDKRHELTALFGARGMTVDFNKGWYFKLKEAGETVESVQLDFRNGTSDKYVAHSEEQKQQAAQEANRRMARLVRRLHEDYQLALHMGADPKGAEETLKKKRWPRKITEAILTGEPPVDGFFAAPGSQKVDPSRFQPDF